MVFIFRLLGIFLFILFILFICFLKEPLLSIEVESVIWEKDFKCNGIQKTTYICKTTLFESKFKSKLQFAFSALCRSKQRKPVAFLTGGSD